MSFLRKIEAAQPRPDERNSADGVTKFEYNWWHIPTNQQGSSVQLFDNHQDFYAKLNQWNRLGRKDWKYWSD
jgi:hypothetical protein